MWSEERMHIHELSVTLQRLVFAKHIHSVLPQKSSFVSSTVKKFGTLWFWIYKLHNKAVSVHNDQFLQHKGNVGILVLNIYFIFEFAVTHKL
jgi:hypothetical protein